MFRCYKCKEVTGPNVPPFLAPTGFYYNADGGMGGDRMGEVLLCPNCAKGFEARKDDLVNAKGGNQYRFLLV